MDSSEMVFSGVDAFMFFWLLPVLVASAYWSFAVGVSQRGRHRHWKRNPALGGPKFTDLLPPYREYWTRGLIFMRWWVALLLPPLLCMPALLAGQVMALDRSWTLGGALVSSLVVGSGLGFVLLFLKLDAQSRYQVGFRDKD